LLCQLKTFLFADTLKEILRELDNKLNEDDILAIIEEVDEDGSGTLDFDGNDDDQLQWFFFFNFLFSLNIKIPLGDLERYIARNYC
jgi:hypothetical protein